MESIILVLVGFVTGSFCMFTWKRLYSNTAKNLFENAIKKTEEQKR